jgi:integrase
MAGTVKYKRLESSSARKRLTRGRQPYWRALGGKVHLGYQCWKGEPAGRWVFRRYIGQSTSKTGKPVAKYRTEALGVADDAETADGVRVLSFEQAEAKARRKVETPVSGATKIERITVRKAMELYIERLKQEDRDGAAANVTSRGNAYILPELGDLVVAELTTERLRQWLETMSKESAQNRPKNNKPQYRPAPSTDDARRARKASANRVLTMLKAILNFIYDEGHVANRDAWGRKLKRYRDVEVANVRYLTVAQAERLINASDPEFRPLVRAALETGCRYSELTRMTVKDFNPDVDTVTVSKSKSGKARHVILTPEGANFFRQHCAGRDGTATMFQHTNGTPWNKSDQQTPMADACAPRITPRISFHGLRHTWASLAVMKNMPLMVVASNLGHSNTRMVEKHYGHMNEDFIKKAIRDSAPRFTGADTPSSVIPMPAGKSKRK